MIGGELRIAESPRRSTGLNYVPASIKPSFASCHFETPLITNKKFVFPSGIRHLIVGHTYALPKTSTKSSRNDFMHLDWIRLAANPH